MAKTAKAVARGPDVQRVAAYVRVSTEDQKRSGLGLGDQRTRCLAMATVKGWPEPTFYADEGVSGTKGLRDRPALARLLEDARAGAVDAVIILSLDRLGRKTRLVLDLVEELAEHGVDIVSCKEQLDTGTPQGQFVLTMFAALAQLERDLISERTRAALAERSRRDGLGAGRLPYGYRRTDDGVSADPIEAEIIRHIFRLHRRGLTLRAIAERMAGVYPPPRGLRWHHTSVAVIVGHKRIYEGGTRGLSAAQWPAVLSGRRVGRA